MVSSRWVFGSSTGIRAFSGEQDDDEREDQERQNRGEGHGLTAGFRAEHRRQGQRAGMARQRGQGHEQRGLGQRGEEHFATGAHPLKTGSGVQRGEHRDKPHQSQEAGEQQKIDREPDKRRAF